MAAYCFWDVRETHDEAAMATYVAAVTETVQAFGGAHVVVGGPWKVVEGDWHPTYPVLIEFPTLADAEAWYESDQYRDLKALRLAATTGDAVFMDGAGADAHNNAEAEAIV